LSPPLGLLKGYTHYKDDSFKEKSWNKKKSLGDVSKAKNCIHSTRLSKLLGLGKVNYII